MYKLKDGEIFVFGSNLLGHHGASGAYDAYLHYGAIPGVIFGPQGNSFAIPTKDENHESLSISRVAEYVKSFLGHANMNRHRTFLLTKIGCGMAGLDEYEVAKLFVNAPPNVILVNGACDPICHAFNWVDDLQEEKWW